MPFSTNAIMITQISKHKVFVSHSSQDKEFVRRLINDLKAHDLEVWFDETNIRVGQSIPEQISLGLKDADYLIIVISNNSVESNWVSAELNSAIMRSYSDKGGVIIPVRLDDSAIPMLLSHLKYANFRESYDEGLSELLRVFGQESETPSSLSATLRQAETGNDCVSRLSKMSLGDLRRLMTEKLSRNEVGSIWFDLFERPMQNDMEGRPLGDCVIELITRSKGRSLIDDLIKTLCKERPDLVRP